MAEKEPMMQAFEWKENPKYQQQAKHFSFEEYYNIDWVISEISKNSFKDIILQFPVENLSDAIRVQACIHKFLPTISIYIVSDHLKNSCCVDLVGSSHINFDVIFHFGVACLSETAGQLPKIRYVLPKIFIEFETFVSKAKDFITLPENAAKQFIILVDQYQHYLKDNFNKTFSEISNVILAQIELDESAKNNNLFYGYYLNKPLKQDQQYEMIFSGSNHSDTLEKIFFAKEKFRINQVYLLQNEQIIESSPFSSNSLVKRLSLIEKTKNVKCFGILIQNPNAEFTKSVAKRVKSVLRFANKKFYIFYMNNLNEAKLNNFPEVEAFVIISCYRNCLFDLKQFYKLIVTPFELELALRNQAFSNYFLLDGLNQSVEDLHLEEIEKEEEESSEQKLKEASASSALVSVSQENKLAVLGIFQTLSHYSARNFQGLDIKQDVEVKLATQGLRGIASSYVSEKETE